MRHPMQKVYRDREGTLRFRENGIVSTLLDSGPFTMNSLATIKFSRADREQFAQLIGYSVSGIGELEYVKRKTLKKADKRAMKLLTPPKS